jgi:hypothetical protein
MVANNGKMVPLTRDQVFFACYTLLATRYFLCSRQALGSLEAAAFPYHTWGKVSQSFLI